MFTGTELVITDPNDDPFQLPRERRLLRLRLVEIRSYVSCVLNVRVCKAHENFYC